MASRTLIGDEPDQILCKVPYKDVMNAIVDTIPNFLSDLDNDTRNVLLTLARIWNTVTTDTIHSKIGVIYSLMEKYKEALYHFNIALTHNPNSDEAKVGIQKLEQILNPPEQGEFEE